MFGPIGNNDEANNNKFVTWFSLFFIIIILLLLLLLLLLLHCLVLTQHQTRIAPTIIKQPLPFLFLFKMVPRINGIMSDHGNRVRFSSSPCVFLSMMTFFLYCWSTFSVPVVFGYTSSYPFSISNRTRKLEHISK